MSNIKDYVGTYTAAKDDLAAFCAENFEFMTTLTMLVETHNAALTQARDAIKADTSDAAFQIGDFRRTKPSITKGYDPTLLPVALLLVPGVVTRVASKYIDELLESGNYDSEAIKSAATVTKTAGKLFAPSEVKVF